MVKVVVKKGLIHVEMELSEEQIMNILDAKDEQTRRIVLGFLYPDKYKLSEEEQKILNETLEKAKEKFDVRRENDKIIFEIKTENRTTYL